MGKSVRKIFVLILCLVLVETVFAQIGSVPFLLNYQGKVTKTDGTPVEGPQTASFFLFDAAQGGTQLWSETAAVQLTKGVFHVLLGQNGSKPLSDLPWDKTYYLQIQIAGIAQFSERTPIVSVPYAIRAQDSYTVGGKKADGSANNLPVLDGQGKLAGTVISLGTVTSDQLASKAVKSANLDDKAVTAGKIDANAVGELQIAAGAIKAGHIAEQQVQKKHIANEAVTAEKLSQIKSADGAAVGTANIQDGAVTAEKLSCRSRAGSVNSRDYVWSISATAMTDIPGTDKLVTAPFTGYMFITASWHFGFGNDGDAQGTMAVIDAVSGDVGNVSNRFAKLQMTSGNATVAQSYIVPVIGGRTYTIKMQARSVNGKQVDIWQMGTCYSYLMVP